MTFEQFLVQAMGIIDSLRQRGVHVFYRAGFGSSVGTDSVGFIASAEIDDGLSFDIELKTESTVPDYEEALARLRTALTMVDDRERVLARLKDLVSALSKAELLALQGETIKQHVRSLIAQRTVS